MVDFDGIGVCRLAWNESGTVFDSQNPVEIFLLKDVSYRGIMTLKLSNHNSQK